MTDKQKTDLIALRGKGYGYKKIALALGLSENTVSSYCRRHNIPAVEDGKTVFCKNCGEIIVLKDGVKPKKYCSDRCRNAWWNGHKDMVNKKAYYELRCSGCGGRFVSYGNQNRKYCSHACYIVSRFGKGAASDG